MTTDSPAIRALNHQTRSTGDNWQYPGDAYDVVGNLGTAAMRFPQALEQINNLIAGLHNAGNLNSTSGLTDEDVSTALEGLSDAHHAAQTLYEALNRAQGALGRLEYKA